jgi:GxxExxY protein
MGDLIYKDECYKIYGVCYEIQNTVGSVFNERQYQDIFESKLKIENIPYEREKELFFEMKDGTKITGNKADFIVFNKIVIDFKTKKFITREDFKQMMRYLKAGKYKLGLIINFRGHKVSIKRVLNSAVVI